MDDIIDDNFTDLDRITLMAMVFNESGRSVLQLVPIAEKKITHILHHIQREIGVSSFSVLFERAASFRIRYGEYREAIKEQQYERAAQIRDELDKGEFRPFYRAYKIRSEFYEDRFGTVEENAVKDYVNAIVAAARGNQVIDQALSSLIIEVKPGTATKHEIAELLSEISVLYRMVSGSGITFKQENVEQLILAGDE